jgi:hypothetical protein
MTRTRATRFTLVIVSLALMAGTAQAQLGATVPNWPSPSSVSGSSSRIRALADVTNPLPFIGVTPCRIVDTRGPAGTFGGPSLAAGAARNFPLPTGPCAGIPGSASAYSLNITVTNTQGPGFLSIYPQGGAAPLVSTLNYLAGQTLANAAIVPAGTSGGIAVVAGVSGTDLIIDINGYYAAAAGDQTNTFKVINSGGAAVPAVWGETTSMNLNATGVYGVASSTTGITDGVWGRNFSNSDFSAGVLGISEGTSGLTFGVYGRSNSGSDGAIGTYGESLGTTGRATGVYGFEASPADNSAGVRGIDYSGSPSASGVFEPAGVRGDSKSNIGVLGISQFVGVSGDLYNSSATSLLAAGFIGYHALSTDYGVFAQIGTIGCASCTKQFVDPHPTDPSKTIHYVSLEGPEAGTYFRGTARTVRGEAVIEVPDHFRWVTQEEGMTVQLTPVGDLAMMAVISQDLNRIVVRSSKDVVFHYLVQGIRPAHRDFRPVVEGSEYAPASTDDRIKEAWPAWTKQRLVENGTYNADGTVNMETAERLGWTKIWAEREAQTQAAAQDAQKAARARRE